MKHQKSSIVIEEYLMQIYSLYSDDKPVKAVHLTERLKTSASTVHATLNRMQRDDLVLIGEKKEISLTHQGMKQAEALVRRHRLAETFLCNVLGIEWYEVHQHAHVLEHGLTPLVEEKLAEFLGFPHACPHGTPIPGSDHKLPENMIFLDQAQIETQVEIVTIDTSLEESPELLRFLQEKNLLPGTRHRIVAKQEETKIIELKSKEQDSTLSFDLACKIGVISLKPGKDQLP